MGDRANLVISQTPVDAAQPLAQVLPGTIVLYTHWGGHDLGPNLAVALAAAENRWDDDGYASRIIVSLIVGADWAKETGHGLYCGSLGDNQHPILVLCFPSMRVLRYGQGYVNPEAAGNATMTGQWSFAEFSQFSEDRARKAHLEGGGRP